jgi:hypothetical protein
MIERIFETKLYKKYQPSRQEVKNGEMWIRLKFLRENLDRASRRGAKSQHIDIGLDRLYKIGEEQDWKCALTGQPLEFTRGGTSWGGKWCNPNSCTLDRINSNKGYIKGNIQLVTWKVNCIKQHFNNSEFIDICRQISKFNK